MDVSQANPYSRDRDVRNMDTYDPWRAGCWRTNTSDLVFILDNTVLNILFYP